MIASWRGLAALAALAVALAVVVIADPGRAPPAVDRALVPGFDPARVTELIWQRPGQPAIRVVRAGGGWQLPPATTATPPIAETTPPIAANAATVGEVLAALRGARWHRRGAPTVAQITLTLIAGSKRRVLGIGAPVDGGDQTWIIDGDRGLVVDRWVARALDRDPLALRVTAPFAELHRARTIAIASPDGAELQIAGIPRQLIAPQHLVLAAEVVDALERALAAVAIVRLPDGPIPPTAAGLTITTTGDDDAARARLVLGGACPGAANLVAVSGTLGDGCVETGVAHALEHAVARLHEPAAAIVDRRPAPREVQQITLADAATLVVSPLQVAGAAADAARVAELLAALAAPAEIAAVPRAPATRQLVVTDRAGSAITLDLYAERVLARRGEPVALRPAPGAWDLLVRPSRALRDPSPWREEPTSISTLRVDGVRYTRGAVIGAWTRQPSGPIDPAAIETLVAALAAPRALGFLDAPITPVHHVILTITPPVGAAIDRVLAVGVRRADGCPALIVANEPVRTTADALLLPAIVCTQIAVLARQGAGTK